MKFKMQQECSDFFLLWKNHFLLKIRENSSLLWSSRYGRIQKDSGARNRENLENERLENERMRFLKISSFQVKSSPSNAFQVPLSS